MKDSSRGRRNYLGSKGRIEWGDGMLGRLECKRRSEGAQVGKWREVKVEKREEGGGGGDD